VAGLAYRLLDHTADIRVEILGRDRAELFANAALCVFDVMLDRSRICECRTLALTVESTDETELLMDWLRELLFAFSSQGFAASRAEVTRLEPCRLEALLHGEPYAPERHGLKLELKVPTYHQFSIEKTPAGWRATVIFDA
jgi:SHS2 domain-containing protein